MKRIQIIEDETLLKNADLENCEVWLLNRVTDTDLDERVVNISELTESPLPCNHKFPQLFTHICERNPNIPIYVYKTEMVLNEDGSSKKDENGKYVYSTEKVEIGSKMSFTYEVITKNKDNYAIHAYVCDERSIKIV